MKSYTRYRPLDEEVLSYIFLSMLVYVNGEEKEISGDMNLHELLGYLGITYREVGLAVSVNGEVVPKSEYKNRRVSEGDSIEIIHIVGGG
ncbi:thiamine biosynthesis protein ThiS [Hydrogenobacter thermophilus TK-6]|nr:sulfur carrier protein ThiS [Hydrogenobacter thermophilus]ADO45935.1 thiamine biosynthesis protein ThiS [Hydrogenobacter thermophilus TK-6]